MKRLFSVLFYFIHIFYFEDKELIIIEPWKFSPKQLNKIIEQMLDGRNNRNYVVRLVPSFGKVCKINSIHEDCSLHILFSASDASIPRIFYCQVSRKTFPFVSDRTVATYSTSLHRKKRKRVNPVINLHIIESSIPSTCLAAKDILLTQNTHELSLGISW